MWHERTEKKDWNQTKHFCFGSKNKVNLQNLFRAFSDIFRILPISSVVFFCPHNKDSIWKVIEVPEAFCKKTSVKSWEKNDRDKWSQLWESP